MIKIIHIERPMVDKPSSLYTLVDADPASLMTVVLAKIDSANSEINDDNSEWREEKGAKVKVPLHFCKFEEVFFPQDIPHGSQFNIYVCKDYLGFALISKRSSCEDN